MIIKTEPDALAKHAALFVHTPASVTKALHWIRDKQAHVNSCASDFDDPEALEAAQELQRHIDREWDSLGDLVTGLRPYSVLRT